MRKKVLLWLAVLHVFVVQVLILANVFAEKKLYLLAFVNLGVLLFLTVLYIFSQKHHTRSNPSHHVDQRKHVKPPHHVSHPEHIEKSTHTREAKENNFQIFLSKFVFVPVLFLLLFASVEKFFLAKNPVSLVWFFVLFFVCLILVFKPLIHQKIYFVKKLFFPRQIMFVFSLSVVFALAVVFVTFWSAVFSLLIAVLIGFFFFLLALTSFRAQGVRKTRRLWSVRLYALMTVILAFGVVL